MKKLMNKKAFTLMEMLIVVAIIAVLVAIAIPTMSSSLEKAKEAADIANIRAAYAEEMVKVVSDDNGSGAAYTTPLTPNTFIDAVKGDLNYPGKMSCTKDEYDVKYTAKKVKNETNAGNYSWELSAKATSTVEATE